MPSHRLHASFSPHERGHFLRAAVVLGFGLGILLDVLLMHELLGWHHTLSAVSTSVRVNEVADGAVLALGWLSILSGIGLLWKAGHARNEQRPTGRSVGGLLIGWAMFNTLDSIVDHFVLGLHHVRADGPGGTFAWDLGFFLVSVAMLAIGVGMARATRDWIDESAEDKPHSRFRRA